MSPLRKSNTPATTAPAAPEPAITLGAIAREALTAADGDVPAARAAVTRRLRKDRKLMAAIVDKAVETAIQAAVAVTNNHRRGAIMRATTGGRAAVVALASGWTAALLDMPLGSGRRLRDANRAEVTEQAERYRKIADDTGHKARWLALIAQSVPDGRTVGDVMTDERAAELWQECRP